MRAIQYRSYGDFDQNRLVDVPIPALADGEVLVAVKAAGINPLDNTFRSGSIFFATPDNLPRIGGQTGVGVVEESRDKRFTQGSRVLIVQSGLGLMRDGTWAEYVAVPGDGLLPAPDTLDDAHAAAFLAGAGYLTGFMALQHLADFQPGQSVLAPGIGGAVGMETVQVAKRLGASIAISTASSTARADAARAAGYDNVIDLSQETLKDGVMRLTDGRGVDAIVDGVSGAVTGQALSALAFKGTMVVVGYAAGRDAEINVTDLIWKAARMRGFTFRMFDPAAIADGRQQLLGFLNEGALKPAVGATFALEEASSATKALADGKVFGRVILTI